MQLAYKDEVFDVRFVLSNFLFGAIADDYRELENELVPEWRVKYLDYNVNIIKPSLGAFLMNRCLAWQKEDHGFLARIA